VGNNNEVLTIKLGNACNQCYMDLHGAESLISCLL